MTYGDAVGRPFARWSAVALAALALAGSAAPAQAQQEASGPAADIGLQELGARARACVALITVHDPAGRKLGTGTGFVVSPDGRVVTNHHVIAGASAATARFEDGRELVVLGLLGDDVARDITVLKIDGRDLPALDLGDIASLRVGDDIVVYGSPLGLSGSLSTGLVSAIREHGPEPATDDPDALERGTLGWGLQITAAISPGSSGSPIMNRRGEVVGVAVGVMPRGQSLNFGVPVSVVREVLQGIRPDAAPRSLGGEGASVLRDLGISALVFLGLGLAYALWTWHDRRAATAARPRRARR
jgi:S1-C subfamily serine protease